MITVLPVVGSSASTISPSAGDTPLPLSGPAARYNAYEAHPNDDFVQAGMCLCVCVSVCRSVCVCMLV